MVGLGNAKQKIQKMSDTAEKLYQRVDEMRQQLQELRQRVEDTHDTVEDVKHDVAEQRALVEALAAEQGIDVDEVLAEAAIEEAEGGGEDSTDGEPASGETPDAAGGSAADPQS